MILRGDKFIIPRRFRLALKRLNVQNFLKTKSGDFGPFCARVYLVANPVWFCLSRQLLLALVLLGLVAVVAPQWVRDTALGVALFVVPQLYLTYYTFRYRRLSNPAYIVHSSRWGHMGKLLLTLSGFALVWRFAQGVDGLVLISVYSLFCLAQVFIASALLKILSQ